MTLRIHLICNSRSDGLLLMVLAWWVWVSEGIVVVEKISLGVCMKDILLCGLGVWYVGRRVCRAMYAGGVLGSYIWWK